MDLKVSDWIVLLCVCIFGVQNSYGFVREMRELNAECTMNGGFCINVIPPPAPRRRQNRRRMRTNTRRGQRPNRPSPQAVGQSHSRLPSSARAAAPMNAAAGYPPQPANQAQGFTPLGQSGAGATMGGAANTAVTQNTNPFADFMGMYPFMFMTRKKRQAAEPGEMAERPRIRRGQNMYNFLNLHCRKTEYMFACRSSGGICCMPPL